MKYMYICPKCGTVFYYDNDAKQKCSVCGYENTQSLNISDEEWNAKSIKERDEIRNMLINKDLNKEYLEKKKETDKQREEYIPTGLNIIRTLIYIGIVVNIILGCVYLYYVVPLAAIFSFIKAGVEVAIIIAIDKRQRNQFWISYFVMIITSIVSRVLANDSSALGVLVFLLVCCIYLATSKKVAQYFEDYIDDKNLEPVLLSDSKEQNSSNIQVNPSVNTDEKTQNNSQEKELHISNSTEDTVYKTNVDFSKFKSDNAAEQIPVLKESKEDRPVALRIESHSNKYKVLSIVAIALVCVLAGLNVFQYLAAQKNQNIITEQTKQINDLTETNKKQSDQIASQEETITSQKTQINDIADKEVDYHDKAVEFKDIIDYAKDNAIGYSSENFHANTGIIVMNQNSEKKVGLTAYWENGGNVETDESNYSVAQVKFSEDSWDQSTTVTISSFNQSGVATISFTNIDTLKSFSIIVIVL
jgi:ribosomal protein L37E